MNTWSAPAKGWPNFHPDGSVVVPTLPARAAELLIERGRCRNEYEDEWGRLSLDAAIHVACHGTVEHDGCDGCFSMVEGLASLIGRPVRVYNDDPAVTDAEVIALLRDEMRKTGAP